MPIDPNVVSQQKKWMKAQDDTQHPNIMKYHKEHKIKRRTGGLHQVMHQVTDYWLHHFSGGISSAGIRWRGVEQTQKTVIGSSFLLGLVIGMFEND